MPWATSWSATRPRLNLSPSACKSGPPKPGRCPHRRWAERVYVAEAEARVGALPNGAPLLGTKHPLFPPDPLVTEVAVMSIEPNLTAVPVVPAMIVADLGRDPAQAPVHPDPEWNQSWHETELPRPKRGAGARQSLEV